MKTVINDIKTKNFKNLYLFTGDELFLAEYYLDAIIKAAVDDPSDSFNCMKISHEEPNVMEIDSFLNSYPFMSDRKVLVLRSTDIMKKATDEIKKYFSSALASVPEYATIIFMEDAIDKRSVIYKAIAKNGYIAEFPMQKGTTLVSWVQKAFRSYGKKIDDATAQYLIDSCNPGMINIKCEIEKLAFYKNENEVINRSDIDALVTKSLESKVFEMADDMARGDMKSARRRLDDMQQLNVKPAEILPAIFSKFSSYRKIKLLSHLPSYQIAQRTKQREYFVKKDLSTVRNLSFERIDRVLLLCQSADYKIKSGKADGKTELALMMTWE